MNEYPTAVPITPPADNPRSAEEFELAAIERDLKYDRRANREHREELRAVALMAAARTYQGLSWYPGKSELDRREEGMLEIANKYYDWIKEDESE